MISSVSNRDFAHPADGFYHIEPIGEHPTADGRYLQIIDGAATRSIVDAFNREARAPGFAGMLIDREHFRHQRDKESRAMGWLVEMEARADGPYGKIRWTDTGRAAVDGGDYRFFSTEYELADVAIIGGNKIPIRVRPTRMSGLTLTNAPNNKRGRPITNRAESGQQLDTWSADPIEVGHPLDRVAELNVILNAGELLLNRAIDPAVADQATWEEALRRAAPQIERAQACCLLRKYGIPQVRDRASMQAIVDKWVSDWRGRQIAAGRPGSFVDAWDALMREQPELFVAWALTLPPAGRVMNRGAQQGAEVPARSASMSPEEAARIFDVEYAAQRSAGLRHDAAWAAARLKLPWAAARMAEWRGQ